MRLLAILKFLLVFALCIAGVYFLLKGFGVATPLITFDRAEARDLPAGIVLVILGIALAYFWRIRVSQTVVTQSTTVGDDGKRKTTKKEARSDARFMPRAD